MYFPASIKSIFQSGFTASFVVIIDPAVPPPITIKSYYSLKSSISIHLLPHTGLFNGPYKAIINNILTISMQYEQHFIFDILKIT